jgi:hypothetical protein
MLSVTYKTFMLSVVMLSVVMLSVVMLNVVMLNVTYKTFMLSVVMLNFVASLIFTEQLPEKPVTAFELSLPGVQRPKLSSSTLPTNKLERL